MNEYVVCDCGIKIQLISKPVFVGGPLTPDEHLLKEARDWAINSPFSRNQPVAALLMQKMIKALDGGAK